jgi:hypothetical protein
MKAFHNRGKKAPWHLLRTSPNAEQVAAGCTKVVVKRRKKWQCIPRPMARSNVFSPPPSSAGGTSRLAAAMGEYDWVRVAGAWASVQRVPPKRVTWLGIAVSLPAGPWRVRWGRAVGGPLCVPVCPPCLVFLPNAVPGHHPQTAGSSYPPPSQPADCGSHSVFFGVGVEQHGRERAKTVPHEPGKACQGGCSRGKHTTRAQDSTAAAVDRRLGVHRTGQCDGLVVLWIRVTVSVGAPGGHGTRPCPVCCPCVPENGRSPLVPVVSAAPGAMHAPLRPPTIHATSACACACCYDRYTRRWW